MTVRFAAVDLGATSGRVMVGQLVDGSVKLDQVTRFLNTPVPTIDGLHWDILGLYRDIVAGLAEATRAGDLASVGIDSWGVDYGLLRGSKLAGIPYHYRDERNVAALARVRRRISAEELFARTGLQHATINTITQLDDDRERGRIAGADQLLLTPDLIGYWLTGAKVAERTIASTTGLLDATTREWDGELAARLDYPLTLFPPLIDAGTTVAPVRAGLGLSTATTLTAVGAHDTASALAAIPATGNDFAFISCGTWGIVGIEAERPLLTEEARLAGLTNEGAVDGRTRIQRNAMGLWILSETVRTWESDGTRIDLPALLSAAAEVAGDVPVFDPDDPVFAAPGDMPTRIASWLAERNLPVPQSRAAVARCIIESLAGGFARAIGRIAEARWSPSPGTRTAPWRSGAASGTAPRTPAGRGAPRSSRSTTAWCLCRRRPPRRGSAPRAPTGHATPARDRSGGPAAPRPRPRRQARRRPRPSSRSAPTRPPGRRRRTGGPSCGPPPPARRTVRSPAPSSQPRSTSLTSITLTSRNPTPVDPSTPTKLTRRSNGRTAEPPARRAGRSHESGRKPATAVPCSRQATYRSLQTGLLTIWLALSVSGSQAACAVVL